MEVAAAGEALPRASSCSPSGEFEALATEFNPLLQKTPHIYYLEVSVAWRSWISP